MKKVLALMMSFLLLAGSLNLSVAETAGEFRGMPYKASDLGFTMLPGDV